MDRLDSSARRSTIVIQRKALDWPAIPQEQNFVFCLLSPLARSLLLAAKVRHLRRRPPNITTPQRGLTPRRLLIHLETNGDAVSHQFCFCICFSFRLLHGLRG
jgi:hypothetical protein